MGYVEQKNHLFPCKIVKVQSVENWKEMLKIDVKDAIFFFFQEEGKGEENISKKRN